MRIIQEPNKVALWNKRHFEGKKTEIMQHVQNIQFVYLLNKYLKCSVWRLVLLYDIYIYMYMSLGFKRLSFLNPRRVTISSTEVKVLNTIALDFLSYLWSDQSEFVALLMIWNLLICPGYIFTPHYSHFLSSIWQIHNTKSVVDHYIRTFADDLKFLLRMLVHRNKWKLVKFVCSWQQWYAIIITAVWCIAFLMSD